MTQPNKELREKLTKIVEPVFATKDHNDIDKAVDQILAFLPQPEEMSEEEIKKKLLEYDHDIWHCVVSHYKDTGCYSGLWTLLGTIASALAGKIKKVEKYCECGNRMVLYGGSLTEEQINSLPCFHCGKPIKQPAKVEGCNDCGHFQLYKMITSGQPYSYSGEAPCYTCKHYQIIQDRHT